MDEVFSLTNSDIYSNKMSIPQSIIEEHFKKLVVEYFEFIHKEDKKIITPNVSMFKFTVVRGLETFGHVFKIVLLYTNNIAAAIYHSQRSMCLYVEFIRQIIENNQTFLRLTSKDAVMYVYKETIFRIKKDKRRSLSIKENIDSSTNEKYQMRENINKILYNVVDYIQNKITQAEIANIDIIKIAKITKINSEKLISNYESS